MSHRTSLDSGMSAVSHHFFMMLRIILGLEEDTVQEHCNLWCMNLACTQQSKHSCEIAFGHVFHEVEEPFVHCPHPWMN